MYSSPDSTGSRTKISPSAKNRPTLMVDLDSSGGGGRLLGDSINNMNNTFRSEGISVSRDQFRVDGEEVEMQVLPADIDICDRLGQGACSTVYRAVHRGTGDSFALKMFNINDKSRRGQLTKELKALSEMKCDCLLNFYGTFLRDGEIGIVLEFMDRGSLEILLESKAVKLSEAAAVGIAYQISWGLGYLHFEYKIHRDIKPGNVLMNSFGQVKLADFGIARKLDNTIAMSSTSVGTFRYMSIERLMGEDYNASSDIWSFGLLLLEIWGKRYPFQASCSSPIELVQTLSDIVDVYDIPIMDDCPRSMQRFLAGIVDKNPKTRARAVDLIQHPWFLEFDIYSVKNAAAAVESWLTNEFDRQPIRRGSSGGGEGKRSYRDTESSYDDFDEKPSSRSQQRYRK